MSEALAWGTFASAGWLLALSTATASAQPAGQLAGVVRDITGAVVPGVHGERHHPRAG